MSQERPDDAPSPPWWERRAAALLRDAEGRVRLLDSCTPTNLREELHALESAFGRGEPRCPRFTYRVGAPGDLVERLERAADELDRDGPLGELYAGRARELALEARLSAAAGSVALAPLAAIRFGPRDEHDEAGAATAATWIAEPGAEAPSPEVRSDDDGDERSLLSRMREEIGRRRIAARVEVRARLAALAAVGPGVVYVAAGRRLTVRDVERTVLHEIEGHLSPRQRAEAMALGIFTCGTARGSDDQEGRALGLEERAGMLGPARRLELARRHLAASTMRGGADFVDTTRRLRGETGAALHDALRIAARVHRGGGLGRELSYLPAYLRVRAAWRRDAGCDRVLEAGRIAVDAVGLLRRWV